MASESVSTNGSKVKETSNTFQYQTEWGPFYLPKLVAEKVGNPERITLTLAPAAE